jgi:tetratricopeptide (TPR) repeat protein
LKARGAGHDLLRLGAFVWIYFLQRAPFEGRSLLEGAISSSDEQSEERVRALTGLSQLALATGDIDAAEPYAHECLAVSRALRIGRGERGALVALGVIRTQQGRFDEAQMYYEESASVAERIGDADGIREAKGALADLALNRGAFDQAEAMVRGALPLFDQPDTQRAMMLLNLGFAAFKREAADVSLEAAKEAMEILCRTEPTLDLRCALELLAAIALTNDACRAALLLAASEMLEPAFGVLPAFELSFHNETLRLLHSRSRAEWASCWEQGAALEPSDALNTALETCDFLSNPMREPR